ncbi:MAG: OsmC family protein [Lentimicrobium sp.]|jgi:putative redox protein|nr:OsmC family protein [Lentimicrobium sp.]MDD2527856.1 OsmC family protein [Lentimicrobiaceae bacterium]MDD4596948.1 OsmC family protein [Lentimicrobiaceae bacterium]MDY0024370.1 OsmC family protein [Lentimicrobium sp.]HAH59797.1 osmotically inducible protein C [Bacteroidales bacterium]
MKHQVNMHWAGKMAFEASAARHTIRIDVDEEKGGEDSGFRPKMLSLASLGGCTGMDVISILKKMKVEPREFSIEVEGELSDDLPQIYNNIHLKYIFRGDSLPEDKLNKAITLSQEKYCGVTAMLKHASHITWEIINQS